jgi:hypothetical protein
MAARLIWIPFSTLPMRLDCESPPAEAPVLARERESGSASLARVEVTMAYQHRGCYWQARVSRKHQAKFFRSQHVTVELPVPARGDEPASLVWTFQGR